MSRICDNIEETLLPALQETLALCAGVDFCIGFRTYERLKAHAEDIKGTLFESQVLHKAIEQIYPYPLRQTAIDTLNRQLRSGIANQVLADLVTALCEEDCLYIVHKKEESNEPRIICSMGLAAKSPA
jgi:hypothetical protein